MGRLNPGEIRHLYWDEELSERDIAAMLDIDRKSIYTVMVENDIPRRSLHEAQLLAKNKYGKRLGEQCWNWNGGKYITISGYIAVRVYPDNPYYCMAPNGRYIREHRLVMAQHLGRPLTSDEMVHHKDGNRRNNNVNNLVLTTKEKHSEEDRKTIVRLEHRVKNLENRNTRLEAELTLLRKQCEVLIVNGKG